VYHYHGYRNYEEALRELAIAEQGMPGDAELIFDRAAIYRRQGQWEQALASFDRAIELDPRNITMLSNHAGAYRSLRDYAQAEHYYNRALEIAPDALGSYWQKALIPLYRDGDVSSLKEALENPPVDLTEAGWLPWLGWTAAVYERDYDTATELLANQQTDVLRETGFLYLTKASASGVTYQLAGSLELAEQEFQAARAQTAAMLEATPDDDEARLYVALGEVLAGLGEPEEAVRMGHRAMMLMPRSRDAVDGPRIQLDAVIRVFVPSGDHESAIEELDVYLSAPGAWSIEGLLPDPRLDPIRDDLRFQALVEKYSRQ